MHWVEIKTISKKEIFVSAIFCIQVIMYSLQRQRLVFSSVFFQSQKHVTAKDIFSYWLTKWNETNQRVQIMNFKIVIFFYNILDIFPMNSPGNKSGMIMLGIFFVVFVVLALLQVEAPKQSKCFIFFPEMFCESNPFASFPGTTRNTNRAPIRNFFYTEMRHNSYDE